MLESGEAVIPDVVRFHRRHARVSGIDFVHDNGARGEKLLPETMGGGAAFFDYDADGDQDLFFVNGAPWPQDGDASSTGNRLYRERRERPHFRGRDDAGSGLEDGS